MLDGRLKPMEEVMAERITSRFNNRTTRLRSCGASSFMAVEPS
jgi:hypothetical protein